MHYRSTNTHAPLADFRTATLQGQAPDQGLYFPERIPQHSMDFISSLPRLSEQEIALQVIEPYTGTAVPRPVLERIVAETVSFPFPLVPVSRDIYSLELFHGPTLAFKDVGARFMSRCLGYFMQHKNRKVTVVVATSGDTGGAVADGFYNVEGIDVVILFPSGKVSNIQELQLTTHGKNITALEVSGSFDDCQQMVKQAFADPDLHSSLDLTSANSINIARWLPQQFYYFFALKQWNDLQQPVMAVPSGNFGNICAGLLAFRSGLPVRHFIAACNANDTIPGYLATGIYAAKPSVPTLSNAMDVGSPNNFIRVLSLFDSQFGELKKQMTAYSISDEETRQTIKDVYERCGYLLDPHGAVGYAALKRYLAANPGEKGIVLETAHPVKFHDSVAAVTGNAVELPESVKQLTQLQKQSIKMNPEYKELKSFLRSLPQ